MEEYVWKCNPFHEIYTFAGVASSKEEAITCMYNVVCNESTDFYHDNAFDRVDRMSICNTIVAGGK